jgi:DNA-directed RNA polymerase subunit RPC12/RpoP
MFIKCPICSNVLEVETEWIGRKVECPYCQSKFIIKNECLQLVRKNINKDRKPKMLWCGVIYLYAFLGLSVLANLLSGKGAMGSVGVGCLMLWGVYQIQQGSKKARLAITIVFSILSILFLCLGWVIGFLLMLILCVPIVLLWLPQCNAWFSSRQSITDSNAD